MNGYIFDAATRRISTKVTNATKCNSVTIKGDGWAKIGTGKYLVTDQVFNEGDILPNIPDRRNELQPLNE